MFCLNIEEWGIASSLTSNLAIEIIERGKVPFTAVRGQILNR